MNLTDQQILATLRSIDQKLARDRGDFEALSDEDKRLYIAVAVKNASLDEVMSHPTVVEAAARQQRIEDEARIAAAKSAGVKDGHRLQNLAAEIGAQTFAKNRRALVGT
jgi:hypothetical protein